MNYYTIILMYTIDNDKCGTRDDFKYTVEKTFDIEPLDQSTYALNTDEAIDIVYEKIKSICDKLTFSKNDSVSLYCADTYTTLSVCKDKSNKIVRYEVILKTHHNETNFRAKNPYI